MKRLFHYILFLFTALMVSNQLFANSTKVSDHLPSSEITYQNESISKDSSLLTFDFESVTNLRQPFFAEKSIKDKIELSESENETEDSQTLQITGTFNFFETFLPTHSSGNLSTQIQNGLAPCKHILYLATIRSFCIIFCVYRI